jgi:rubrerythrin
MPMTKAEISRRYDNSPKGRRKKQEWAEANRNHLTEYHKKWVKKNAKKAAASVAKWRRENPSMYAAQCRAYRLRNKEKFAAYRKFKRAIKLGVLLRPDRCQKCGEQTRIDAHHHNGYDKPLDVLWLCRQCHVDAHKITP